MGYAATGSAVVGALAVGVLGGYNPSGFIWSSNWAALAAIVIIAVPMLVVYFVLLRLFRVTEVQDLLGPIVGRLGGRFARGGATPSSAPAHDDAAAAGSRGGPAEAPITAALSTISDDTGIIPRISGQFDPVMYRARPATAPVEKIPGRHTFQGPPGENPHFPDDSDHHRPEA
jgi:putative peptidoglycan lipid II flippase